MTRDECQVKVRVGSSFRHVNGEWRIVVTKIKNQYLRVVMTYSKTQEKYEEKVNWFDLEDYVIYNKWWEVIE